MRRIEPEMPKKVPPARTSSSFEASWKNGRLQGCLDTALFDALGKATF